MKLISFAPVEISFQVWVTSIHVLFKYGGCLFYSWIMNNFSLVASLQVGELRQRFFHSIAPGGLAGDRRAVVPASGFSFSAQQIWKVIKENKDLDLPAHKVRIRKAFIEANNMSYFKLMHWL